MNEIMATPGFVRLCSDLLDEIPLDEWMPEHKKLAKSIEYDIEKRKEREKRWKK